MTIPLAAKLLLIFGMFSISCGQSKPEPEKPDWKIKQEKLQDLKEKNQDAGLNLSQNEKAIIGWDTLKAFTYELQEKLNNSLAPISFTGKINDIIKKDSTYILKVYSHNHSTDYIAYISASVQQFQNLISQLPSKKFNTYGCFILESGMITPKSPMLTSEIELDGTDIDDASSYITLSFDEKLIVLSGKLKAFFIYKQIEAE